MQYITIPNYAKETAQTAARGVLDNVDSKVTALGTAVAGATSAANDAAAAAEYAAKSTQASTILAKMDALEQIMAQNRLATVTVRVNPTGSTYQLPSSSAAQAALLAGAKVVFHEQGVAYPYEATVDSLENWSHTFQVYVTDASEIYLSTVGLVLGHSDSAGYGAAAHKFRLKNGDALVLDFLTSPLTGTAVEVCRIQPYVEDPTSNQLAANDPLKVGVSFVGTRITDANGTQFHYGHYASDGVTWVDESLTSISIYDYPEVASGETRVPVERVLTDGGSANAVPVEERLNCVSQMKIVDVSFEADATTLTGSKFVRYAPLWVKTEFTTLALPIADAGGSYTAGTNVQPVVIKWYANSQVDASYHLHPLFVRYERQNDGSYAEIPLSHGYISRYPLGKDQNVAIGGVTKTVSLATSGTGREWVPGNKYVTLGRVTPLNATAVTISASGEEDIEIAANADSRLVSVASMPEISFLQWMAYLYFGINVQGAADAANPDNNIFPGICTSAVSGTTNGATDDLVAAGIMNGAVNTKAVTNSIVFMGVEDALWSSTGWYDMGATYVRRRTITTDATGAITANELTAGWLIATDRADYNPGSVNPNIETVDDDTLSFEFQLTHAGYRCLSFPAWKGGWPYRQGYDPAAMVRDGFYPTSFQKGYDEASGGLANINSGGCDQMWAIGDPADFGNFSQTTAYTVGTFVKYDGKLWKCIQAREASAWDETDFSLVASGTVIRRDYAMVPLGVYRSYGASLGSFCVAADHDLLASGGGNWRARPSLQPVS